MVTPIPISLIDTTFIFENTHKAFIGTQFFTKDGQDNTFLFGFIRDFIRLRYSLVGTNIAVLAIGKEAYSVTTKDNIHNVINLLKKLGVPYIFDSNKSILVISSDLSSKISNIITQDKKILQLSKDNLPVIFPNDLKDIDCMSPNVIKSRIGVSPIHIPTYLALVEGSKASRLTKLQAIRLIELYGDINGIYENLSKITSTIKKKLTINMETIITKYSEMRIEGNGTSLSYNISNSNLNLNNEKNINLLTSYGFYSLTRLLKPPSKVRLNFTTDKKESSSYNAIVDSKGIMELESLLFAPEFCAIDTEADNKDPRHATLFGVSFSVTKGEAFFVPLLENDLKDISRNDVVSFFKRIFEKPIKFIGHNIKYDYLLLRKNGIKIQNIHFDTMLAAYECYGDWTFFNLKYLSHKLLGKEIKSYKEIVDKEQTFLELPFKKIVKHACEDADITLQLYQVLYKELEKKEIIEQYYIDTLPMVKKLGDLEFNGVLVNLEKLERIRKNIFNKSLDLRQNIYNKIGKEFDIDSQKELSVIINDNLDLQKFVGSNKITLYVLEQLSINNPVPRLIAQYKRTQKQIKTIDSIVKGVKDNKIHPIFNQIRSSYGQLSSTSPNIFDNDGIENFKSCFSKTVGPYLRDKKRSLDMLENLTQDPNLNQYRVKKNQFMESHTQMKGLNKEDFLLAVVIGYSDSKLSNLFMIDRLTVSTIRHDLELRCSTSFQWLENFKKKTVKQGYAINNNKRKYFDGLKSSNIEKRKKALSLSVRWLIQY